MTKLKFEKIPFLATLVIFICSLIIIFSPLRPQITSVTPELKTDQQLLTYKNEQYGFEFQYPATLFLTEDSNYLYIGSRNISYFFEGSKGSPVEIGLYDNKDRTSPDQYIAQNKNMVGRGVFEKTKFANFDAVVETRDQAKDLLIFRDNHIIKIGYSSYHEDDPEFPGESTFNQILSTFKLTDSSLKSQIENWANYKPNSSINSDAINNPCEGSDIKKINEVIAKTNQTGFECQTIDEVQFCTTPNFFNWNTSQFKELKLGCAAASLSPFIAVKDKLVWSRFGCSSGFLPEDPRESKIEQDRIDICQATSKEAKLIYSQ